MTSAEIIELVKAVGLAITSVASLIAAVAALLGLRATKLVVKHTNSMKDQLVAEVRASALAQGKKEEKDNPGS